MKSLFISTYRWLDTTYGNTYFSSVVSIDGQIAFSLPFQYGYDRADEEALRRELIERGLIEQGAGLRRELEAIGCHYYRATQYTRKREAEQHGELMPFMVGQAH